MSEKELIYEELKQIEDTISHVLERTKNIKSVDDFLLTSHGVDMLDVACIRLEAIGEAVKKIDKQSEGKLLKKYPTIPWKKVMGMRDVIAHHYFDVDVEIVFGIVKNDLMPLLQVVGQMKNELSI